MVATRPDGVLCLEGDWDEEYPISRQTIEPALEMLERMDYLRLHHRNVNSPTELWLHLDRWINDRAYRPFHVLYLGFHGSEECIAVGGVEIGLDEIQRKLRGACGDSVLFFAACGALKSSPDVLQRLCKETDASAVVGYTKDVDFIEAAAFELLLFPRLMSMNSPKVLHRQIAKDYPDLAGRLGFTVATSKWVSEPLAN